MTTKENIIIATPIKGRETAFRYTMSNGAKHHLRTNGATAENINYMYGYPEYTTIVSIDLVFVK